MTSEQLQNNFQKAQKTCFLTLEIVKMTYTEGQNLYQKFDFSRELFAQKFTRA